jgi:ribosomal protein L31E
MAEKKVERILFVNLSKAYDKPTTKRGNYAIKLLRLIVAKNSKSSAEYVSISNSVASTILRRREYPVRRMKVKLVPEDQIIKVMLPEEKLVEEKAEKKEEKKAEPKKEVKKEERKEEKHVGGERKAPGEKEEKTEEEKQKDKERKELQKLKK